MFHRRVAAVSSILPRNIGSAGPPAEGRGNAYVPAARAALTNYAALDLGTNNCRLLIARNAAAGGLPADRSRNGGLRVIDAFSRIVRLGEGLAATGALSEAAMARTIEALRVCAGKIGQRSVARGRYVATEACRRAGNCAQFL